MTDPLAPLLDLPGVAEAAEEARVAVDRLLGHRVLRRRSAEVSAESAVRGAWASAALDGAGSALADVRSGAATDPVTQGALRVATGLGPLVDTWERAPRQVLARLHLLAARDLVDPAAPAEALGRPDPAAADRLELLSQVLVARTAAPAVVVAAFVHGELLAGRPFPVGSGVVARAAARLTLVTRGLDPKGLAVPEVGHRELAGEYAELAAGYGTPEGVAAWIRHCCAATALGAREGLAICEAVLRAPART
ncbi:MAG: oxidoreductase [Mycobacteriales bacterium]